MSTAQLSKLVCAALALSLLVTSSGCWEEQSGHNLFNPPPREKSGSGTNRRPSDRELTRQINQAFDLSTYHDNKGTTAAIVKYGLTIAGIGVLVIGLFVWEMWRKKQLDWELNDPMALVKELNTVHHLSEPEKAFMQQISKKSSLNNPLKLFIEPQILLDAWENEIADSDRLTIQKLLLKLFDIQVGEAGTASVMIEIENSNSNIANSNIAASM